MAQLLTNQATTTRWRYTTIGMLLGILVGSINRGIAAILFHHTIGYTVITQLLAFGIGGIIAGAIQGGFCWRYLHSPLVWISVTCFGWMLTSLPELWFPNQTFSLWLCDNVMRRALVGGLSGGLVGIGQALALRRSDMARWWTVISILAWAVLWILPALIFDNYLLVGEGGCLD